MEESDGPRDTFITLLDKARRRTPSKECCVAYDIYLKRTSLTFKEIWALSCRYAYILKQHGLERGDYVVVTTPLSLEYMVASFGVILAGGSHISMEKFFSDCAMIKETLQMSQSKVLIVSDVNDCEVWDYFKGNSTDFSFATKSASYHDGVHSLQKILFTPKSKDPWKRGFLDELRLCTGEYVDLELTPQDGAIVCGSLNPKIAAPKLAEFSHGALACMAREWVKHVDLKKTHYVYPFYLIGTFPLDILFGYTRVISDFLESPVRNMTQHIIEVSYAESLTTNLLAPIEINKMMDILKSRLNVRLPRFNNVFSGGMPITRTLMSKARLLGETFLYSYITSETGIISINRLGPGDEFTPFDCGPPLPGVQVRILSDQDEDVGPGERGLIAVKSGCLFARYVGDAERTEAAWTKDGWFKTNDVGRWTSNGHLIVYGRQTEAISRGIVFTYPSWLEAPIASHPEVLEVTVVGVPDPLNFESTCACVVKRPGSRLTELNIHDMVLNSMSSEGSEYFALDYVVFFEESLTQVPRHELETLAAKKLRLPHLQSKEMIALI